MRHLTKKHTLGKAKDQRDALLHALATELFTHGEIKTTLARAKALRPYVEELITLAKKGDLTSRRQAAKFIYDKEIGKFIDVATGEVFETVEEEEPTTTITIEELELSVRAYNCLKRASINSMAELLKKSEHDLLNIKNFGKKSSDEVIERLHHFGLDLAPNPELPEEELV